MIGADFVFKKTNKKTNKKTDKKTPAVVWDADFEKHYNDWKTDPVHFADLDENYDTPVYPATKRRLMGRLAAEIAQA